MASDLNTGGGDEKPELVPVPALKPIPMPQVRRKVDLSGATLPSLAETKMVEALVVREKKGPGATFSPQLEGALPFYGLVNKPLDAFEAEYQIISGSLLHDPRITSRAKTLAFIPAYDWSAHEMILVPLKMNKYGTRVMLDLQKVAAKTAMFKAFIEWSESLRRHVVHYNILTDAEKELLTTVKWPTREEMLDALSAVAFDNIDDLAAANAEIAMLLGAVEVK
jgi:hypothetical protein